ncbi:hypothetical protein AX774_g4375 [Zancudomyces culisetae]|uniref:Uncharacterized protein n=1 Tax=Zancudomyces culisetae TaxID=1213189 RepID=A0A1R1PMI9_ZANCU|nr:hypothetical protein AX774_g4375 [Zancudomyces culisetae]|eukprot:OMH82153.1 hypothetical protein AX774_g4375 [Zancudomyces culisetae]
MLPMSHQLPQPLHHHLVVLNFHLSICFYFFTSFDFVVCKRLNIIRQHFVKHFYMQTRPIVAATHVLLFMSKPQSILTPIIFLSLLLVPFFPLIIAFSLLPAAALTIPLISNLL